MSPTEPTELFEGEDRYSWSEAFRVIERFAITIEERTLLGLEVQS